MVKAINEYKQVRDRYMFSRIRRKERQAESYDDEEEEYSSNDDNSDEDKFNNVVAPVIMGAGLSSRK